MCSNSRYIFNRYSHKFVLVSCGKCEACRQEKAQRRSNRIRNHSKDGYITLFCTLTYAPDFLPYVYKDDFKIGEPFVYVWRKYDIRHYRGREIKFQPSKPIACVSLYDDSRFDCTGIKSPRGGDSDTFSVIVYDDVKRFFKRLRINLKRDYGIEQQISYFSCSEYGPLTHRAHHHLLIRCKRDYVEEVSTSIVKSWSYADRTRTEKYIEIAKDAASYVSSYVNCSNTLPEVLTSHAFMQKHSYSKNYGVGLECFSLDSLLEKFRRRDFTYTVSKIVDGVSTLVDIPIPEYVVNRYFPKFKGYFLLSPDEVRKLLSIPLGLASTISARCLESDIDMSYSMDEVHKLRVRMLNIFDKYFKPVYHTFERFLNEYPQLYVDFRTAYMCFLNRNTYETVLPLTGLESFYENIQDVANGRVRSDLSVSDSFQFYPQFRKDIVLKDSHFKELYYKLDKSRKVNNLVLQNEYI